MDIQKHKEVIDRIQEKVGNDVAGIISDDLAILINDNKTMNDEILNKDKEIEKVKTYNENLLASNSSLLQQVSMDIEETIIEEKNQKDKETPFDFRTVFDKNGNFKNELT